MFFNILQNSHWCQSLFFNKIPVLTPATLFKKPLAQVFSCEFCKTFRDIFFYRTPRVAASGLSHILLWLSWYYNFYFALFRSIMSGKCLNKKISMINKVTFLKKVIVWCFNTSSQNDGFYCFHTQWEVFFQIKFHPRMKFY